MTRVEMQKNGRKECARMKQEKLAKTFGDVQSSQALQTNERDGEGRSYSDTPRQHCTECHLSFVEQKQRERWNRRLLLKGAALAEIQSA